MEELDQITVHGYLMTSLHRDQAQAIVRRSRMTMLEELASTQDENRRLIRATRQLQQEHDLALQLIRALANRGEAFRRLVVHLRQAWQPMSADEFPLKESLKPLLDAKKREVENDADYARTRDAEVERRVHPDRPHLTRTGQV